MPRPSGGGRPLPSHFFSLDIRWLRRHGYFATGARGTIGQTLNGQAAGECRISNDGGSFTVTMSGRSHWLGLVTTPQHFGGERTWFQCPRCFERCGVLYAPRSGASGFACRECRRVAYQSQRESARYRPMLRARKIRARLGGGANMLDPFPARPYGMHQATYDRMRAQDLRLQGYMAVQFPKRLVSSASR